MGSPTNVKKKSESPKSPTHLAPATMSSKELANEDAIEEEQQSSLQPTRHSVFTRKQKWSIIILVAYAAWFSTLSSAIYYPAIPFLARSLHESTSRINLTVTTYMAVATIAPALLGDAADILGRRPVYILVLSIYTITCMAIALVRTYDALLGLRLVQAAAVSGTFSIAYGVVADVSSPAERGTFASVVSFASTAAPTLGPILGGALTYAAGWPWIFWFLCIASGLGLVAIIFMLPETARNLVGDGSFPPPLLNRIPRIPILSRIIKLALPPKHESLGAEIFHVGHKRRFPNPFKSLQILIRPDNSVIITACGLLYIPYTCLSASLASLCVPIYGLSEWEGGLIYIPFGIGGIVSTFISSWILDRAWYKHRLARGLPTDKAVGDDLDAFAVEKTRLSTIWIPMVVTVLSIVGFGWSLHFHLHIAVPLAAQFFAGLALQLDFTIYNTLLVDKNHHSPAAAQAASNVVRCAFAAIMIAFLQDIIDRMGIGWTFTFMAAVCLVAIGLFAVDYCVGQKIRMRYLSNRKNDTNE